MLERTKISLSKLSPHYYPYSLLPYLSVFFRGKEITTISGPNGLKEANQDESYIILNNGRKLIGEVKIVEEAPF